MVKGLRWHRRSLASLCRRKRKTGIVDWMIVAVVVDWFVDWTVGLLIDVVVERQGTFLPSFYFCF